MLQHLSALLLAAGVVHGLQHTSPFFMLTSQPLRPETFESVQISTASDIEHGILSSLQDCSNTNVVLLSRPGLQTTDFQDATAMPKLRRHLENKGDGSLVEVPAVVGQMNAEHMAQRISKRCGLAQHTKSLVHGAASLTLQTTGGGRHAPAQHLVTDFDNEVATWLSELESAQRPYAIIFVGSQDSHSTHQTYDHVDPPYEMDEPYPTLHTDLKRDLEAQAHRRHVESRQSNGTENPQSSLPLFEKYQFLTPGIFMGLSVSLLLFIILYVGVSAIAGVQVSYQAFSKEMGPAAQKKQQQ